MKKLAFLIAPLALATSFCAPTAAFATTLDSTNLAPQPRSATVLAPTSEATLQETYSGTCGDNASWTLDTYTGILTISGTGAMADYGLVNAPWYSYRGSIKSVVIQSGITTVGADAFAICTALASASLPEGITSIGDNAFVGCSSLTSVAIPTSVTAIGDRAFSQCDSITSVLIPSAVTSIGYDSFWECQSLASFSVESGNTTYSSPDGRCLVENGNKLLYYAYASGDSYSIPSTITFTEDNVFQDCSKLTAVTLPSSLTRLGETVFLGCKSLASFSVESGNTTYSSPDGRCLVENGNKLIYYAGASGTAYSIPSTITTIGDSAFYSCSLTSVDIPSTVTSIENYAFWACKSLTSVVIPEGVSSLGQWAFQKCSSLRSVSLPSTITSVGSLAFDYIASGSVITCPTQDAANLLVAGTNYSSGLTTVLVPTYSGTCGDDAYWALDADTGTLTIYGTGAMTNYASYKDTPWYDYRDSFKSVVVQPGVTTIGWFAFTENTSLESVSIPSSVTSVGRYSFCDCTFLASATLPEGVSSIGEYAFRYCTSLPIVNIPSTVTSIGELAFQACWSSTGFSVAEGNTTFSSPDGRCLLEGTNLICYAVASGSSYTAPSSVTSISSYAFYGASSLTSVTIPEGVTSIGNYAFTNCSSLESVFLPSSVTIIESGAFRTLPSGSVITCATRDVANLFVDGTNYESSDTKIVVESLHGTCGDNMTWTYDAESGALYISGSGTMYDYSTDNPAPWSDLNVTSVTIGPDVENIGTYAFYGQSSIKEFSIQAPVLTSVGAGALIGASPHIYSETSDNKGLFIEGVNYGDPFDPIYYTDLPPIHSSDYYVVAVDSPDVDPTYSYTLIKTVQPTCTLPGQNIYSICNLDGTPTGKTRTEDIHPKGHQYGTWTTTTRATTSTLGSRYRVCSVCSDVLTQAIPLVTRDPLFPDVTNTSAWYYDSVYCANDAGYITGYDDGTFGPNDTLTRAQAATILWRYYCPYSSSHTNTTTVKNATGMSDVEDGKWYTAAANWAVARGVISGKNDGTAFDPKGVITREQLCAIIANASEHYKGSVIAGSDVTLMKSMPDAGSVHDWATDSVAWSLNVGLISGKENKGGHFIAPSGKVTRAEMAAIMMNAMDGDLFGDPEEVVF